MPEETETVVGPGRKKGAMKRDDQGRLLKKDGSLAKALGRKKGKIETVEKEVKKPGKRGRPAGKKNKETVEVKKPKGKRGRPAGKKTTTTISMPKDIKEAIKDFDKASKALVKALSK